MNMDALYLLLCTIEQGGSQLGVTHNERHWQGIPTNIRYLCDMGYLKFKATAPAAKPFTSRYRAESRAQRNLYRVTPAGHAIVAKLRTEIENGPGGRT